MAGNGGRLTKEQTEALKRAAAREKESDEQKWIRAAIREEIGEWAEDFFSGEGSGEEPKQSGPGRVLDSIFGKAASS